MQEGSIKKKTVWTCW